MDAAGAIPEPVDPSQFEAAGAVATHSADTTSVHGITDTAALIAGALGAIADSIAVRDANGQTVKAGGGTLTSAGLMTINSFMLASGACVGTGVAAGFAAIGQYIVVSSGVQKAAIYTTGINLQVASQIYFSATTNSQGATAAALGLSGTTGIQVHNGTPGTYRDFIARTISAGTSLIVGGGTPITAVLSATAVLDYGSIAAGATQEMTIIVTGASGGNAVFVGAPAAIEADLMITAYVSGSDNVIVRLHNPTGSPIDPASATWRAVVFKF